MPEINGQPGDYSKIASFFSAYQAAVSASPHHFERVARKVDTTTVDSNVVMIVGLSAACGVCLCFTLMCAMIYFFMMRGSKK